VTGIYDSMTAQLLMRAICKVPLTADVTTTSGCDRTMSHATSQTDVGAVSAVSVTSMLARDYTGLTC